MKDFREKAFPKSKIKRLKSTIFLPVDFNGLENGQIAVWDISVKAEKHLGENYEMEN